MKDSSAVAQASDATLDESGTVLGERYRLVRPLGEGGAGIVYVATDERIGAEVALKVVRGSARRDEITLARFHREARAAGKLGHPNIVRVTDFGTSERGSPYVVMERLDGETLEARIAREGPLDPAIAIDVHIQLADALAAAHAAGVLHRDVKPANVFLTQLATGKHLVKLLDFGLAELYQEPGSPRITERGLLVGSLAYLAPERLLGAPADEQSDVYAIGASLHEALTGELPFTAPNPMMMRARILDGALGPIETERPQIGPELAAIVRSCLARDPKERLPTAAEVRRRLVQASEGMTRRAPAAPAATASAAVKPAAPQPTSHALGVAIVLIVLLGIGLAVALMERGPRSDSPATSTSTSPATSPATSTSTPTSTSPATSTPTSTSTSTSPATSTSTSPAISTSPSTSTSTSRSTSPSPSHPRPPRPAPLPPPETGTDTETSPATPDTTPPPEPPSRFDHVLEPDWGEPLPR